MGDGLPVYHSGRIHVMADLCPTCVFRPGNLMKLLPGRLQGMVQDSLADDAAITCHSTLYGQAPQEAICRAFWDRYKTASFPLRMAVFLGNIDYMEV